MMLKYELAKQGGFKSLEQEAFLSILRTADLLLADVADLLKPHGLSATQYNVLRILRGGGAGCCGGGKPDPAAPGLACKDIAPRMITRDPDLTRLLDRLEGRGLVQRARESADRRVVRTRITDRGLALLAELDRPMLELHQRQLAHLGEPALRSLADLLQRVRSRPG